MSCLEFELGVLVCLQRRNDVMFCKVGFLDIYGDDAIAYPGRGDAIAYPGRGDAIAKRDRIRYIAINFIYLVNLNTAEFTWKLK